MMGISFTRAFIVNVWNNSFEVINIHVSFINCMLTLFIYWMKFCWISWRLTSWISWIHAHFIWT